jgi:hypothetical protein
MDALFLGGGSRLRNRASFTRQGDRGLRLLGGRSILQFRFYCGAQHAHELRIHRPQFEPGALLDPFVHGRRNPQRDLLHALKPSHAVVPLGFLAIQSSPSQASSHRKQCGIRFSTGTAKNRKFPTMAPRDRSRFLDSIFLVARPSLIVPSPRWTMKSTDCGFCFCDVSH